MRKWFDYDHLPPHLAEVSKRFAELADFMLTLPPHPERNVALRKLLESKDAAVRAAVIKHERDARLGRGRGRKHEDPDEDDEPSVPKYREIEFPIEGLTSQHVWYSADTPPIGAAKEMQIEIVGDLRQGLWAVSTCTWRNLPWLAKAWRFIAASPQETETSHRSRDWRPTPKES